MKFALDDNEKVVEKFFFNECPNDALVVCIKK